MNYAGVFLQKISSSQKITNHKHKLRQITTTPNKTSAMCSATHIFLSVPCYGRRLAEVEMEESEVAWSYPEKQVLREQIRKRWCNINWCWCVPESAGLSGVCFPKEGLSGAERDRLHESLTLSVSWWKRGGLGKKTPSPTDTQINTLPV